MHRLLGKATQRGAEAMTWSLFFSLVTVLMVIGYLAALKWEKR